MKKLKLTFTLLLLSSFFNIQAAVILTECNSCRSNASFEFFAKMKFVENDTTVIILNNVAEVSRKYRVSITKNTQGIHQSDADESTYGIYDRIALREKFTPSEQNIIDTFQGVLISEKYNHNEVRIPKIILDTGVHVDSMWDLLSNSGRRFHFDRYLYDNNGRVKTFTDWLDNVVQKFGIISFDIAIKFTLEFSDGSMILIEIKNELINYLEYIDADSNEVTNEVPRGIYDASHSSLQNWSLWFQWINSLKHYHLEYAQANFDGAACRSLTTTCRRQWVPDSDNKGEDNKIADYTDVCTLSCND